LPEESKAYEFLELNEELKEEKIQKDTIHQI